MGSPPATSKVVVTRGTHELVVEERSTPRPTGSEILIRIEATGVCATDLHLVRKSIPYLQPKVNICGHEGVGRIVELGPDVDSSEWKVNERVSHRWIFKWCGQCEGCKDGNEQFCDNRSLSGKDVDGCWAGSYHTLSNASGRLWRNGLTCTRVYVGRKQVSPQTA
jgi:alcohol dehydrogenase, propanol-preferring